MRGVVRALEHLREATKGAHDALDDLERRLRALVEAVGQAIRVLAAAHHAGPAGVAAVHAPHAAAQHRVVAAAVHGSAHATEPVVGRCVAVVPAHAAVRGGAVGGAGGVGGVVGGVAVDDGAEGRGLGRQGGWFGG